MGAFRNYSTNGLLFAFGFEPLSVAGEDIAEDFSGTLKKGQTLGQREGQVIWGGFNSKFGKMPGQIMPDPIKASSGTWGAKALRIGGSGLNVGFTMWNAYRGYQENGIWGAKDSIVWDMAAAAGAARFAFGSIGTSGPSANISILQRAKNVGMKEAGTVIRMGGGGGALLGMGRIGGAAIGAQIGQQILGTPGAFIGGYIGAAPIRFAATHPLIAGGMVAGAAAAGLGYATYSVVKNGAAAGYKHTQNRKGIDTAGSMASFMTQSAMTMRARAVQDIQKSYLNSRSALGQEAGFMHMPNKNYHSLYR